MARFSRFRESVGCWLAPPSSAYVTRRGKREERETWWKIIIERRSCAARVSCCVRVCVCACLFSWWCHRQMGQGCRCSRSEAQVGVALRFRCFFFRKSLVVVVVAKRSPIGCCRCARLCNAFSRLRFEVWVSVVLFLGKGGKKCTRGIYIICQRGGSILSRSWWPTKAAEDGIRGEA